MAAKMLRKPASALFSVCLARVICASRSDKALSLAATIPATNSRKRVGSRTILSTAETTASSKGCIGSCGASQEMGERKALRAHTR